MNVAGRGCLPRACSAGTTTLAYHHHCAACGDSASRLVRVHRAPRFLSHCAVLRPSIGMWYTFGRYIRYDRTRRTTTAPATAYTWRAC